MRYRRRIILINKKFQLRFSLFVCSWVMILSLVFPSILFSAIETFIRILSRKLDATTLQVIQNFRQEMITSMVIFMVVFAVIIFLVSIFLSNRIAGPVYRVQTALRRWKKGTVEKGIVFRKADNFTDLAIAYNDTAEQFDEMKERVTVTQKQLKRLAEELDSKHRARVNELIEELQCAVIKK